MLSEKKILNETKKHNPPLQVKWSVLYKLIKQQRGKLSRFIEELQIDDQFFQSHDNIMSGWNKHFGQLAQKYDYEKFDKKISRINRKRKRNKHPNM